jgi:TonB family protein
MKKFSFLIFTVLLFSLNVDAQRKNTYLLKNNGEYVSNADSADYVRQVEEPAKDSDLYPTKEYYINGSRKSVGQTSRIEPLCLEGRHISFFKNGKRKQISTYLHGKIIDSVYNYYPNGKLYTISYRRSPIDTSIYITTLKDSTGKDLVVNGTGEGITFDDDFNYITEKGNFKDGLREGLWTGEIKDKKITFKEVYAAGKVVSGESKDENGQTYQYTKSFIQPEFTGGMKAFYQFIARNVRYPRDAVDKRAQGTVIVRFTVLTDGTLSNIHAINYADKDLVTEAVRMMKTSKKWQPGVYRGKISAITFDSPITFTLGQ